MNFFYFKANNFQIICTRENHVQTPLQLGLWPHPPSLFKTTAHFHKNQKSVLTKRSLVSLSNLKGWLWKPPNITNLACKQEIVIINSCFIVQLNSKLIFLYWQKWNIQGCPELRSPIAKVKLSRHNGGVSLTTNGFTFYLKGLFVSAFQRTVMLESVYWIHFREFNS